MNKINIDELCELLIEGRTYREIAKHFKTSLTSLAYFMSNSEHSARARMTLEESADIIADKAEEVLKNAKGTMPEIQRAKELAQYYKWKAATRNRKRYSDKLDIDQKTTLVEQPLFQLPDVHPDNGNG